MAGTESAMVAKHGSSKVAASVASGSSAGALIGWAGIIGLVAVGGYVVYKSIDAKGTNSEPEKEIIVPESG